MSESESTQSNNASDNESEDSSNMSESGRSTTDILKTVKVTDEDDILDEFESLSTEKDSENRLKKINSIISFFQSDYIAYSSFSQYDTMVDKILKFLKKPQIEFRKICSLLGLICYANSEEWNYMINDIYPLLLETIRRNDNDDIRVPALKALTNIIIYNVEDVSFVQSHFDSILQLLKQKLSPCMLVETFKSLLYSSCFYNLRISYVQLITTLINYLSNTSIDVKAQCIETIIYFLSQYFEINDIKINERNNRIENHFHMLYEQINLIDSLVTNKKNILLKNNLRDLKHLLDGRDNYEKKISKLSFKIRLTLYSDIIKYNMIKEMIGKEVVSHIQNNPKLNSLFCSEIEETNAYSHSSGKSTSNEYKKKVKERCNGRNKARDRKYGC